MNTEPFGVFAGIGVLIFLWASGLALLRYVDWKCGKKT